MRHPFRFVLPAILTISSTAVAQHQISPTFPGKAAARSPVVTKDSHPTIDQFLSPSSPLEIAVAKKADRVAWIAYEKGMRNVYTAAAPDFKAVRLTNFMQDDGVDITSVQLSDDGKIATFIRGAGPNRVGWVANPSHDPNGGERAVWAARTDGTGAWRLAKLIESEVGQPPAPGAGFGGRGGGGAGPDLSPDGKTVVWVREGQIFRAKTAKGAEAAMDTGGIPFIKEWGRQGGLKWSPDGSKLAFVSTRENHSLIGVYDMKTRKVEFLSPSTDFDASPTWSPDGKRIAYIRRPGTPFGLQTQSGGGGIGNPGGAAAAGAPGGGRGGRGGGGGGGRGAVDPNRSTEPGLFSAAFADGSTLGFWVADVATGKGERFWHNQPKDSTFNNINEIRWGGDQVIFTATPPKDEWDRYYAVSISNPQPQPVLLTTTDGLINDGVADRTFVTTSISPDGKTLYYATNANDIEKRHVWAVPTSGGTPKQISTDDGVEVSPEPMSSGKRLAVLYFGPKTPASVGIVPTDGGATKIIYPTLSKYFPQAEHVVPEIVLTKAADSLTIHNQLFLPPDLKPGEKRPAIVFVHGGPSRQMLPAYHYMQFYHWAYAFNQYLANQGYVVLSINYRSGIGYGNSFRRAPNTEGRGNSEYQDVVAGGKYLQSRPDVDPTRVGIWGLSYGGLLTAEALARNSDMFVAGVDLAGVHLYGNQLDTNNLAFMSSAAAHIDTWKSPVMLEQGDDDRNVDFSQMIGLVDLLRAHNIYYELTVIPDDVHESLEYNRWIDIFTKSGDFLRRFVWEKQTPAMTGSK